MKKLSIEEAVRILEDMKVKFPVPRAAETQIKRNDALEMAIKALATDINVGDKDTISRKAAIDEGMSYINGDCFCDKEDFAKYIEFIEQLPPAQPTPDQNGDLWITVPDIDKVTCIYVQESKSKFCRIFYEER
jgi:hypothetical protein